MRLINDFIGLGSKRWFVLIPMVSTKEEFSAARQNYAHIGLSSAAVAPIRCCQILAGERRGHVNLLWVSPSVTCLAEISRQAGLISP